MSSPFGESETRPAPPTRSAPRPDPAPAPATPEPRTRPARVPHTRTGMAWVTAGLAVVIAIALIIFIAQNTRSTEVTFLWMSASTPLAVALLVAAVGSVLLTLILGTARIAQLRRLVRKNRDRTAVKESP